MVCQICGKKSGYYPLCNEHFKMRDKGLVAKCEKCKKWHLVSDGCSRCSKPSDDEKGDIELPLPGDISAIIFGLNMHQAERKKIKNIFSEDQEIIYLQAIKVKNKFKLEIVGAE